METIKIATSKTPYITQIGNELKCNLDGKYQWFLDGIAIENENHSNHKTNKKGVYEVRVINEIGCALNSEPLKITFTKDKLNNSSEE